MKKNGWRNKKKKYHCPVCKNEGIIEFDDFIHCSKCDLDFDKDLFGVVDDENMLSRRELGGIVGSFTDEERKKLLENDL